MNQAIRLNTEETNTSQTEMLGQPTKPKILVVEDDITFEPFWSAIAERADRNAQVFWATSELEAESMIIAAIEAGRPYNLVITDIFLSGSRTGIDLWIKFYKQLHGRIIVTSGIEYQKFVQYFSRQKFGQSICKNL